MFVKRTFMIFILALASNFTGKNVYTVVSVNVLAFLPADV